ncbi:phage tail protein [Xanthomonas sp. NCPPB 2632]|jgi:microcystin-dependent protein|uniref:phage tail protein n=1 Tax=Xanthomonas sp. NCPPB 2632 TaxID=3240912 RepID=UPI003510EE66
MSDPFVGEIRMLGFSRVPQGWLACDGSLVSISDYQVLYVLLGTTYGGDGVNTFGVPDMRGRLPIGQGQGPGLGSYVVGQKSGTETVTLSTPQLPMHNHIAVATTDTGTSATPGASAVLGGIAPDTMYTPDITGLTGYTMATSAVGNQGGSQPHNNLMPTLSVPFYIAYLGIYPTPP